jgi:hypothetical protein
VEGEGGVRSRPRVIMRHWRAGWILVEVGPALDWEVGLEGGEVWGSGSCANVCSSCSRCLSSASGRPGRKRSQMCVFVNVVKVTRACSNVVYGRL